MARMNKQQLLAGTDENPKDWKFIENNTLECTREDGTRIIRHFRTNILTFNPDGTIVFNTDGFRKMTTKVRMNNHQDMVDIWQDKRVWYVRAQKRVEFSNGTGFFMTRDPDAEVFVYADGMSYHPEHGFKGVGRKPDKRMLKALRKYSKDFAAALPVDMPSGGDCWYCAMTNAEGVTMGDQANDTSHLVSHVFEKPPYYVPSLLMHALTEAQRGYYIKACAFKGEHPGAYMESLLDSYRSQMAKDIYNYLYERLINKRFRASEKTTGFAVY